MSDRDEERIRRECKFESSLILKLQVPPARASRTRAAGAMCGADERACGVGRGAARAGECGGAVEGREVPPRAAGPPSLQPSSHALLDRCPSEAWWRSGREHCTEGVDVARDGGRGVCGAACGGVRRGVRGQSLSKALTIDPHNTIFTKQVPLPQPPHAMTP